MSKRLPLMLLLALIVTILIASTAAAQETYLGLLGETVEMPSLWGGTTRSIDLFETPSETLLAMPEGEDIRYGVIKLGNGADIFISLAIRLGDEPLIWVDSNNNEDLFDDGSPTADAGHTWYREVTVSYWEDSVHSAAPYVVQLRAVKIFNEWRFIYSGGCARKGLIQIESTPSTIWLLDADTDGLFNDIAELTVIIDNNGDGEIELFFQSPEWFGYGGSYLDEELIQIDDAFFGIIDASSDGRTILLERLDTDIDPLPNLQVGYPVPLQTASTLTGEKINLSQYLGRPLLLLFAPLFQLYPEHLEDCPPAEDARFSNCISDFTCPKSSGANRAMRRTQQLIESAINSTEDLGFETLLIATDPQFLWLTTVNTFDQIDLPFPILWDEELAMRYRNGIYDAIIVDQQGIITARDGWTSYYDESGRLVRFDFNPLSEMRIGEILGALIEDEV